VIRFISEKMLKYSLSDNERYKGDVSFMLFFMLFLLGMGSFFSLALVFFFQRKLKLGILMLLLGFATTFLFYYSIHMGWIDVPK
jgi:hypothetical protein